MTTRLLIGDCRALLATLEPESAHTCVTSPPYFGLRDYGTATWTGGDVECDHIASELRRGINLANSVASTRGGATKAATIAGIPYRDACGKCGAERVDGQIGLEATPEAYVAELVAVFREVRRVLRDDGTLWLNLGDSYASDTKWGGASSSKNEAKQGYARAQERGQTGVPSKNLLGIPWRVAFALQADGWYLRSDIIWHKPNPMPESVTDRPTKAHEYLFLLAKSPTYYYDGDAIAEAVTSNESDVRKMLEAQERIGGKTLEASDPLYAANAETNIGQKRAVGNGVTRNRRTVWTVATAPYSGAHFATFPPALIEPCILAGAPHGGTVLDPFGGAGTTGLVADRLGRDAILCELNPAYAALARERIVGDASLFAEVI